MRCGCDDRPAAKARHPLVEIEILVRTARSEAGQRRDLRDVLERRALALEGQLAEVRRALEALDAD